MKFTIRDLDERLFVVKLYPRDNDLEYLEDILKYIPDDRKDLKHYMSGIIEKHEEYYHNREIHKKMFEPKISNPIAWNK